ncbi:hypothetical protein FRZ67_05045 [Panacibacter ginsenosidivorans]|uniref:Uncharacterized protein n=1 Tax=Panacibacter ginsenosidivorans TaxID=1813871 RepID=A0A5B8V7M1_9BACT|nr:hypothetical protein [Panacibacter ginsenosidivorans]QEC66696.1 hypothetical protein FRZ67_05045 [Panacibacter ginsenosidivorans]
MKFRLLLLTLLLVSAAVHAQKITGIWRGYFNSGYGYFKQQYKYEVQINELTNKALQKGIQGVTYSYRTTVFYGKASLQGIYDSKNKSLTIKETKLVELKIADKSEPCLMTCYLDYRKEGETEILEGSFISVNMNSKGDCGSGYVYLEKVEESDFVKEDFLVKKNKPAIKPPVAKTTPPANTTPKAQPLAGNKKNTTAPPVVKKSTPDVKKPVAPKAGDNTVKRKSTDTSPDTIVKMTPVVPKVVNPTDDILSKKTLPVPDVIKDRDNPLVKKITTASQDIQIQLYDNGEIDGDTITVYDNNQVIAFRRGLTKKAITINIKATADNPYHEIVMVANNLGTIPPNTALMVITTDGRHYELFVSSDEKKNAKVVIEYKQPGTDSK